ncbi:LysR family transcriptional regulator [Breoghania corrubedonensis]|uniref:LysR family transcriptional regulator n=1 Tax=Breoghania corrubedonensis TaxID=665038 RepID=A0A2T5USB2_9HYPH|nr:LysR family transcriptional regulator [Breoghania corrubedonensis]PTW54380.1 LysR family transcriptional regulator [Breoghania corrubedonensis]
MVPSFRQIQAFLAVATHLKFTRAAEELHISQPALTVQINQLETTLSIKLFNRTKRRVSLTAAGQDLLPLFERISADIDNVMTASSDIYQARRGVVRIATLPSVASRVLPITLASFRETHPNIRVRIRDVVAEKIIEMVKSEEVDFGIGTRLTPDKEIKVENFLTDYICAFYQRGHPIEEAPKVLKMTDCVPYPLILTQQNSSVRVLFERAMAREGAEVEIAAEANYMSTALGMVRAGLGVAILPMSAIDAGNALGLGYRQIDAPWLNRRVGLIRKASRTLSPVAEHFIKALHDVAESLPNTTFRTTKRSELSLFDGKTT